MEKYESTYETQAMEFLIKTQTVFSAKYLGYMKHFKTDKENRDVYEIKLERNGKSFTFNFGQSINDSTKKSKNGVKVLVKPTAYDVLACLTKYDPETFDCFCANYGYDTDSRNALETYLAVQDEWSNVNRLFNDVLDELTEIN